MKIINQLREWIGFNAENGGRNAIIDTYNAIRPLPQGYKAKYSDSWCAITLSAAAHLCGYPTDIFPYECSCQRMIEKAKSMGIWRENEDYLPQRGDIVLFDWQDSGDGDNTGWADHVGVVETADPISSTFWTIEGNTNINGVRQVGRKSYSVNQRYLRGFICPNYPEFNGSLDRFDNECIGGWAVSDRTVEIDIIGAGIQRQLLANEYRPDIESISGFTTTPSALGLDNGHYWVYADGRLLGEATLNTSSADLHEIARTLSQIANELIDISDVLSLIK